MIGMPYDRDGAPHLALIVGTGTARAASRIWMRTGRVSYPIALWIPKWNEPELCAVRGRDGRRLADCAGMGGRGDAGHARNGRRAGEKLSGVTADGGDGRSAAGGRRIHGGRREAQAAAGFLARVNALGETLFAVATTMRRLNGGRQFSGFVPGRTARGSSISTRTAACWAPARL